MNKKKLLVLSLVLMLVLTSFALGCEPENDIPVNDDLEPEIPEDVPEMEEPEMEDPDYPDDDEEPENEIDPDIEEELEDL